MTGSATLRLSTAALIIASLALLLAAGLTTALAQTGTRLSIDVAPDEENTPSSFGTIVTCARASVGDRFQVDIIIEDVTDLLAWEIPVSYDPQVLEVVGSEASAFLGQSSGSQVLEQSERVPSNRGFYTLQAVDVADPAAPESGSGVLGSVTFHAIAEGTSPVDIAILRDDDGNPVRGPALRDADTDLIGDPDGVGISEVPIAAAEIRVGEDCPDSGARVVTDSSDGTSLLTIIIIALAVAAAVTLAAVALMILRRRGTEA